VLAATVRLRTARWWPTQPRWRLVVVVVLMAGVFVAGAATVRLYGGGRPGSQSPGRQAGAVVRAAATARQQAAAWVARQISTDVIVACDPAMCAALQGQHVPAGQLLVLTPARPDPLGSELVVATPAVRGQFRARLADVYAPVRLATFGSGVARIDVRAVAPDGATAYRRQLAADIRERKAAGALLLRNHGIRVTGAARAQLADGLVDSRLLVTLATLSQLHPIDVVSFGSSSPGVSAAMPLRSADIAGAASRGGSHPASLASLRAFFGAQQTPYQPSSLETVRITAGKTVLRVEYGLPYPLGLLGTRS
jgi:hypothetical protein